MACAGGPVTCPAALPGIEGNCNSTEGSLRQLQFLIIVRTFSQAPSNHHPRHSSYSSVSSAAAYAVHSILTLIISHVGVTHVETVVQFSAIVLPFFTTLDTFTSTYRWLSIKYKTRAKSAFYCLFARCFSEFGKGKSPGGVGVTVGAGVGVGSGVGGGTGWGADCGSVTSSDGTQACR